MFANYTGKQIGLNDNSEIFLKIKPEFYNDIIKYPKIPVSTSFTTDNIIIEKIFALNLGYNPLEKIKKLFNNNNFRLNVNIGGFPANDVNYITENCELSLEKKEIGVGGPGLNFVGIETGKIINLDFNKNAPNLRIINKGLNIFGFCNNSICKAYMKEKEYVEMIKKYGVSEEALLKRYDLVIYLKSLSVSMPELYENESNICRQSSLGQAQILDEKVKNIWGKHPNFREIPTFEMFEDKFKELISILEKFISNQNMPITRNSKFLGL